MITYSMSTTVPQEWIHCFSNSTVLGTKRSQTVPKLTNEPDYMQFEHLPTNAANLPLHSGGALSDGLLIIALSAGTVFSILIALLSFAAFVRRQTVSYLLVALAFSTFLGKTSLGLMYLRGSMNADMHHSLEHSLDVVMIVLVLAAVYHARSGEVQTVDDI